ncbi:MAG TPA: ABC transporter substrate-binding protein [Candidatus Sulfotelmatobacter sp.]|nr:ABC transporter substrate-binding protein [Candidatus Sulfotelmatobacter sp.]
MPQDHDPVPPGRLRREAPRATLGLAAILSLLFAPPPASAAGAPVKIGILLPTTGPFTVLGKDCINGFDLYVEKAGGKTGGRDLVLIKEDSEGKPDVGLTKVKKLVERDGVDVVVGPVNSAVALAIKPYVQAQGVPQVIPVAFTRDITAPGKNSPWIFRVIETTDQSNFTMGGWMVKHTPHRRLTVMISDFVAGRHSGEAFMAGFRAAGGQVVKEIYAPLNSADFGPYLAQVNVTPADAVWAWFGGADPVRLVKQYEEYGLKAKLPLYGYNTLVDDVILPTLGDAALGVVTVGHYSATIDTPANKAFVQDYERKYGRWPTRYSETGYTSAQLILAALEELKGEGGDRAKLRDALRGAVTKIQPPRGPIRFDQYQQVITDIYITRVERQGGRLVNAIVDRIPAVSQEDTWKWWNK